MSVERTIFVAMSNGAAEPDHVRNHCVELLNGPDAGRRIGVPPEGLVIGRTAPADLILADQDVSRAHCRLACNERGLTVTDLDSTNGTFIDGARVTGSIMLPVGAVLQVGSRQLKHELLTEGQLRKSLELDRDIAAAASYIQALLPPPISSGPVLTDWCYEPSAKLGGDAFGYGYLDPQHFAFYLMDVAGHGAGAALHAVSVMNVLRQRALPGADMSDPGAVLEALNALFPMEQHADMYFTIWYGVFDTATRDLAYASAGHHPAFLALPQGQTALPGARNPIIGAVPGRRYKSERTVIPSASSVYLFSDGVFEIVKSDGSIWDIEGFVTEELNASVAGPGESRRLCQTVRARTRGGELDDDFSLLIVHLA
jgi:serine phosphatase RsbU (regulator of sigma subunit)